jgi:hypothetical protein
VYFISFHFMQAAAAPHSQSHTTRLPSGPTAWYSALWRAAAAATEENVCTPKASAATSGAAGAAGPGVGGCAFWGEATEAAAAGESLPGCTGAMDWCIGKGDDASAGAAREAGRDESAQRAHL